MRVCDTYGAGFFFIPGTDTCLRVGGYVRMVGYVNERTSAASNVFQTRTRILLNFDARSNTEYGLLRSYGEFFVQRGAAGAGLPFTVSGTGAGITGQASATYLSRAFVQFAGFTFGHSASFFNFYQDDVKLDDAGGTAAASAIGVNLIAYTASFGSGMSATVSVEDNQYRRVGQVQSWAQILGGAAVNYANGIQYNGQQMPDLVANLRIDQGWGSAQVMAALHEARATTGGVNFSKTGYAIGAGLRLNLDMLARGDVLWLQAVYADGALSYAWTNVNSDSIVSSRSQIAVKALTVDYADAAVAGGVMQTSKTWAFHAGFRHFWTPALRSALWGTYATVDAPAASTMADFSITRIGANTIWSPVRNLDLGVEVVYQSLQRRAAQGLAASSQNGWVGYLRVQRNF